MDITNLFTINASEVNPENNWTNEFLPGWTTFKEENPKSKISHREIIIVEPRERIYLEPIKIKEEENNTVFEPGKGESNEENEQLIGKFFFKKPFRLYATYSSDLPREINYYEHYYIAREEIKQIIRIHERMHAFHHVNPDCVWDNFGATSFVYLEFLAQIFTFKCIQGTLLEPYFKKLSDIQPYIYQTWKPASSLTPEEVIGLYHEIKKTGTTTFGDLNILAKAYDQFPSENRADSFDGSRLHHAHDEIFKNDESYQQHKINCLVSDTINDLW